MTNPLRPPQDNMRVATLDGALSIYLQALDRRTSHLHVLLTTQQNLLTTCAKVEDLSQGAPPKKQGAPLTRMASITTFFEILIAALIKSQGWA